MILYNVINCYRHNASTTKFTVKFGVGVYKGRHNPSKAIIKFYTNIYFGNRLPQKKLEHKKIKFYFKSHQTLLIFYVVNYWMETIHLILCNESALNYFLCIGLDVIVSIYIFSSYIRINIELRYLRNDFFPLSLLFMPSIKMMSSGHSTIIVF